MAIMKREEKNYKAKEKKSGFSEKEFLAYLEERFRKLRLDEQKFREEVLAGSTYLSSNRNYTKINS
jgi:hypothetical protein